MTNITASFHIRENNLKLQQKVPNLPANLHNVLGDTVGYINICPVLLSEVIFQITGDDLVAMGNPIEEI